MSDFVTPWTKACQASLSLTISWSFPNFVSIASGMPSSHLILCCPLLLLPSVFPSIRVFPVNQLFVSGGQRIGASASASVLPMSIQGWSPLKLTDLISLLSKGLSESSPAPQFENINSLAFCLLYGPALTTIRDYWKDHSFNCTDLCWQSDVFAF